jgi:hypothetical protein
LLRKLILGEGESEESSSFDKLTGIIERLGAVEQLSGWRVLLLAPIR